MKKGRERWMVRKSDLGMYSPVNNDGPWEVVLGRKPVACNSLQTTVLPVGLDNIAGAWWFGTLWFAANIKPYKEIHLNEITKGYSLQLVYFGGCHLFCSMRLSLRNSHATQEIHQQLPKTILFLVGFQFQKSHLPLPGESHQKCVRRRCT